MAGVELSGVDAAHPLLFENAVYVLSPMKLNSHQNIRRLAGFLEMLGSRIVVLDPKTHDEVASAVSHLPQLAAVALMNVAGREHRSSRKHLRLAAGGFRDLTRIASSRPEMWKDILKFNSDEIAKSIALLVQGTRALSPFSPSERNAACRKIPFCAQDSRQYPEVDEGIPLSACRIVSFREGQTGHVGEDDFSAGESGVQH